VCARFGHWLIGFLIHLSFSLTALGIAIKDWDRDCEDDNTLAVSGSGWLITCEAISILYAILLLPGFIWWEPRIHKKSTIALKVYFALVVIFFTLFFIGWDILGVFLLFEEIDDCRSNGLWIMSVVTLVRSWLHFAYPTSVVIFREIENCWSRGSDESSGSIELQTDPER